MAKKKSKTTKQKIIKIVIIKRSKPLRVPDLEISEQEFLEEMIKTNQVIT